MQYFISHPGWFWFSRPIKLEGLGKNLRLSIKTPEVSQFRNKVRTKAYALGLKTKLKEVPTNTA